MALLIPQANILANGWLILKSNFDVPGSSKKLTKHTQDSEFCLFFGRIKDIIICFGDLLTSSRKFQKHQELGGEGGLFNSWLSEP